MSHVIAENALKNRIEKGELLSGFDLRCIEGIKYDFRLGNKFLKSYFARPTDYNQLSIEERRNAVIKPNEFVFVLSEEKLNLPANAYVELSQKRKLSHAGIQLFGGFTVDPGYEGHLLFGMYNHSSTDFPLEPGKKLVGAIFYELDVAEMQNIPSNYHPPRSIDEFSEDLIRLIKSYEPVTLSAVQSDLAELKEAIKKDESWKQTFQNSLDKSKESFDEAFKKNETLITQISLSLESEKTNRIDADKRLEESINSLSKDVNKTNNAVNRLLWAFGATGTAIVGAVVARFFGIL